mgnify:CR=1 FL=1
MAQNYTEDVTTGTGGVCRLTLHVAGDGDYGVTDDEEYKTEPLVTWLCHGHTVYGWYQTSKCDTIVGLRTDTNFGSRVAFSWQDLKSSHQLRGWYRPSDFDASAYTGINYFVEKYEQSQGGYPENPQNTNNATYLPSGSLAYSDWRVDSASYEFSLNIPVFLTTADMNSYLRTGANIEDALNYKEPETSPEGEYFEITNMWTHGTWLNDTQPQVSGQPYYRNFRGKMVEGTFSLYVIGKGKAVDGKLMLGIKNGASFVDMEYSTNGIDWIATDTFPFEYFLRKRTVELGEFDYALTFANSKIPIFKDEETAQGYEDGDVDITEADNWTDISQNYPIINNTAQSDDNTEMGHVYTRSFFSQQYICSWQAIQQISNAMFDTTSNIFEDIKKGLECYGERIVDSVQSCMFFPIDLSTVYSNVAYIPYIFFGGYQFNLSDGVTVGKITYPDGYYDFGSFDLMYSFGSKDNQSFRDFSPYTRLFCYLAYIGWVELDTSRYMGHTVNIRYYFDTRTGMCMACLFVQTSQGQVLYDYYQGQCGVSMPITLTDHTSYANAQIQTLLGGVNDTKGNMGTVFNAGVNMAEKGLMTTGSAMALGSVGLGAVGIGATKTLYGLTQNNINNFNKTKGSSSSMLNMCLPQECLFMFEIQQGKPTDYELELVGFPSNASDLLLNFSGYLEIDSVKLSCSGATDNEKAEIIRQLQSGVYI